jgi:hypothetical protein
MHIESSAVDLPGALPAVSFDGSDYGARALQRVKPASCSPSEWVFGLKIHKVLFDSGVERQELTSCRGRRPHLDLVAPLNETANMVV